MPRASTVKTEEISVVPKKRAPRKRVASVDIAEENIKERGRLQSGQMIGLDLKFGKVLKDEDINQYLDGRPNLDLVDARGQNRNPDPGG